VNDWLIEGFPNTYSQITQTETNFTGYYIQNVNYILGSKIRLCFILSDKNPSFNNSVFESDYYKSYDTDKLNENTYTGNSSGTMYYYTDTGLNNEGSYCMDIPLDTYNYTTKIQNIIADKLISDMMMRMSIEFISFEAS
jgi:hypothetical protein